ncbi:hypothetical protein HQ865_04445 [Mucilaginibacter mali]|uniref:Uncharacterized protein n=1 Tax=Mucilaginibacter mali TaxID=2740462 RepID=A0A7D4Q696_9SPHI|nr:hypothetical protein [Mucilaginibacter mali]QKJ29031.1 hypothetical protein HQ865_04445 [Mucilaginibacter mali]
MDAAKNITSANYIRDLDFAYMETYSLQRGPAFEERLNDLLAERKRLKIAYGGRWTDDGFKVQLASIEQKIYAQYLVDDNGQFHWSAQLMRTIDKHDAATDRLKSILLIDAKEVPAWMCAPVYRDAIVFYDANSNRISCLNICFDCDYMITDHLVYVDTDASAYVKLKALFLESGHDINSPIARINRL